MKSFEEIKTEHDKQKFAFNDNIDILFGLNNNKLYTEIAIKSDKLIVFTLNCDAISPAKLRECADKIDHYLKENRVRGERSNHVIVDYEVCK